MLSSLLSRLATGFRDPVAFFGTGVVFAVGGFQLWITPDNPPGFHHDEASLALNSYTLSQDLHDENGALLPLFFPSFRDYKNPVFTYALALVFRVTGPSQGVARGLAAVSVLAAVLLLGLLAWRITRSRPLALIVIVAAGTMPWLFEFGRVAYDTAVLPLALVLVLVASHACERMPGLRRGVALGLSLTFLAFASTAGRLLAPLLAIGLIALLRRDNLRGVAVAWATFALTTVVPFAVYAVRHPGALTARYEATKFASEGLSLWGMIGHGLSNYVHDLNLWEWSRAGDPKPYVHTWGAGMLYGAVAIVGVAGLAYALVARRSDAWLRYVTLGIFLVAIPAALTEDRFYALRLVGLPVFLLVLGTVALDRARTIERRWLAVPAVALAALTVVQFVDFFDAYRNRGPARGVVFEAGVAPLLATVFAKREQVYVDHDDAYALTHARWYAASHHLSQRLVTRLSDGGIPPNGSMVFGRLQACDYRCDAIAKWEEYFAARAVVPAT